MTRYVTVKIPEEIGAQIDRVMYRAGYSSRAEFVKDAVRRLLEKLNGYEAGPAQNDSDRRVESAGSP